MSYHAVVEESPDGGYWASVRELPGCFSSGETLAELQGNLREAISLHLEELDNEPIPRGTLHAILKTIGVDPATGK